MLVRRPYGKDYLYQNRRDLFLRRQAGL